MTRTLRVRLTVWHVSTLALTLSAFAILSYRVLSHSLYRHHDDELARQADDLIRALDDIGLTQSEIGEALLESPIGSRFVMVRDRRGEMLYRDPVLQSSERNIGQNEALVHAATSGPSSAVFFTVELERSGEVRFICTPLRPGNAYLQIGDPLGDIRATLHTVAIACLPIIPGVLFLSSFVGWMIAKRALAPMRSITASLQGIQATDLSRRLEVQPTDRELGALVATLNQLLDRLQRAFESLSQFAGDVSHQIQTPLTVIRGALDAALREPGRAPADMALVQSLIGEVEEIRAITVDLRSLALADAPIRDAAPVNLSDAVAEACDIVSALGELRNVDVAFRIEPGVTVRGDATRLKQVVLNLGDNAVKYTPAGGRVTIQLETIGGDAVLRVTDTGVGISEEHVARLFDRLFRAAPAKRSAEGTGLGLAIVKRIVDVHQGTIEVQSEVDVGSTFVVRLPGS